MVLDGWFQGDTMSEVFSLGNYCVCFSANPDVFLIYRKLGIKTIENKEIGIYDATYYTEEDMKKLLIRLNRTDKLKYIFKNNESKK